MEKASYRDNLELIRQRVGNKLMLNVSEAAELVGMCRHTASARLPFTNHRISVAVLARWMCGGES